MGGQRFMPVFLTCVLLLSGSVTPAFSSESSQGTALPKVVNRIPEIHIMAPAQIAPALAAKPAQAQTQPLSQAQHSLRINLMSPNLQERTPNNVLPSSDDPDQLRINVVGPMNHPEILPATQTAKMYNNIPHQKVAEQTAQQPVMYVLPTTRPTLPNQIMGRPTLPTTVAGPKITKPAAPCGVPTARPPIVFVLPQPDPCVVSPPRPVPVVSPPQAGTAAPRPRYNIVISTTTEAPTQQPTQQPSQQPSMLPTAEPTAFPTALPTLFPTFMPSMIPTVQPTVTPTEHPTEVPTPSPTVVPTQLPTRAPTLDPTPFPTHIPTAEPTHFPTHIPTDEPTADPTEVPTEEPTFAPTEAPTAMPTAVPTEVPTTLPPTTDEPSFSPTHTPTEEPTAMPTFTPTESPTLMPTFVPTEEPSALPTLEPTELPTAVPTPAPSLTPTVTPTLAPTVLPTTVPTMLPTQNPTAVPTETPTFLPSKPVLLTPAPTTCNAMQFSLISQLCASMFANVATLTVDRCDSTCIAAIKTYTLSCQYTNTETIRNQLAPLMSKCGVLTVPTPAPETSCVPPSQVMIALDASGSISSKDWDTFMKFAHKLVAELPIAKEQMQVGLIKFATEAVLEQPLTDDKSALVKAEQSITRDAGIRTYMSKATAIARQQLTNKNVPRTLVVITDGLPSNRSATTEQFHAAKAEGIHVVMVTIGFLANMIPPTDSWLSMPAITIREGFAYLESSRLTIQKAIVTSVHNFVPCPGQPSAAPTSVPTALPSAVPTRDRSCRHRPSEVMLALDGSGSISQKDWERFMTFTDKLIKALPIATGQMQVGLIEFATTSVLVQPLTDNKSVIEKARKEKLTREQGIRTYMSKATAIARQQLTNKNVPRTLVVITDGLPSNRSATTEQFHAAKAEGIHVVMVTVGFLANMIMPTESWLSTPAIQIRTGFAALEASQGKIVESISTSVCEFVPPLQAVLPATATPSNPPYCLSSNAQCKSPCGGVINSANECERAATLLGSKNIQDNVQEEATNSGRPRGCYVYTGSDFPHGVYFNAAGTLQSTKTDAKAICLPSAA